MGIGLWGRYPKLVSSRRTPDVCGRRLHHRADGGPYRDFLKCRLLWPGKSDGNPMAATDPNKPASGNLFLDNVHSSAREALQPLIRHVSLKQGREIYAAGESIEAVFFPLTAVISVVSDMADGDSVEVGIVGREGMTAYCLALGESRSIHRTTVQIAGDAFCLETPGLQEAMEREPALKDQMLRYAQASIINLAQSAACNRLHPANERCARWLLIAHDRVDGDTVLLTQEFLGQMLGLRRASVTLAATALQEAGIISYSRGHISIRNRNGLEAVACECYESAEKNWKNVMRYTISKDGVAQ